MLRFLERHARKGVEVVTTTRHFDLPRSSPTVQVKRADLERETDPRRLQQRQKQIDIGKKSEAYQRYVQRVPKSRRRRQDPRTPDIHKKCSKRGFDGQVKAWRKQLHSLFPDDTVGPRKHGGEAVDGQGTAATEVGDNQTQRKGAGQGSSLDYIFAPSAPETEVAGGLSEEDLYEGL